MSENSYTFIVHWPDEEPEEEQTEALEDDFLDEPEESDEVEDNADDESEPPAPVLVTSAELEKSNQSCQYWRTECPEVLTTAKNVIRYYPTACKLKVSLPNYFNRRKGETFEGKGVGLSLDALKAAPETLNRLIQILLALNE